MIKQEKIIINGIELIKTYSDSNKFIIQDKTGYEYIESIDLPDKHTYIESNNDIPDNIEKIMEVENEFNQ